MQAQALAIADLGNDQQQARDRDDYAPLIGKDLRQQFIHLHALVV
jgi:hypothetical protein